jgi:uroporphyrinogen decarboxylase
MSSPFLDVLRGKEPEHTPVWFMRQAGRYMESYRRLKAGRNVLEVARDPESSSEVVADAVKRLGVDAGIIFADIMLPLEGMGVRFKIEEDIGPVVSNPVRTPEDVESLSELHPEEDVGFVMDGIERAVEKTGDVPLIGFSGAPFTLASYMIEGAPSRDMQRTRRFMHEHREAWARMMAKLSRMAAAYLSAQVNHGVKAVQLFDSWAGVLSEDEYVSGVKPFTSEVFRSLEGVVPRIHFCADSQRLLHRFWETGPDAMSVDWRFPIGEVWTRCSPRAVAQGNLDPVLAALGGSEMEDAVSRILAEAEGKKHIFGLGHGVIRSTSEDTLRALVERVHSATRNPR